MYTLQEEILHFVQNDKLPYLIVNKTVIVVIQSKSVSLSKLKNPAAHPFATGQ